MKDYKKLASAIYERQSVRNYSDKKIDFLEDNTDLVQKFDLAPLFKDVRFKAVMLKNGEAVKNNRSDYCIGFFSDETGGGFENVGFIGQQLSLELHNLGIGTCWWGFKKPAREYRTDDGLKFVISMSAGYPEGTLIRKYPDGFVRKPLKEIALCGQDEYTEAVRLSPSAVNNQPWLVEKRENTYNFYMAKPKNLIDRLLVINNMRKIDMGIGMAHLFIKAKADGYNVDFKADGQNLSDALYIATATLF
ncbi:MAG: hypothetical protein LBQ27_02845 [Clostridiales bacterium]|jgi:nitroreductase|nr:hypothetical protein [Clostridiales bacterium]